MNEFYYLVSFYDSFLCIVSIIFFIVFVVWYFLMPKIWMIANVFEWIFLFSVILSFLHVKWNMFLTLFCLNFKWNIFLIIFEAALCSRAQAHVIFIYDTQAFHYHYLFLLVFATWHFLMPKISVKNKGEQNKVK